MKIKFKQHLEYTNINRCYEIKDGITTIKATVFAIIEKGNGNNVEGEIDINDVELEFYLNGKKTRYFSFKELYEKLFFAKFDDYHEEITRKVESFLMNEFNENKF